MTRYPKIAWTNGRLATMDPAVDGQYGLLEDHVLVTEGPLITALFPAGELKAEDFDQRFDLKNALVTPGLIDCHTHLVFAGQRAGEWEMRLNGVAYADIARAGGGINSTVAATRRAGFNELYDRSYKRLRVLAAEGVTTVEIKSGYGLDLAGERKTLEVVKALREKTGLDISPTLLTAHSLPPEYAGRPDDFIDEIIGRIMPELWREGLFEAVDIFIENIGFDLKQTERLFRAARELGIPVKAHAEQLSNIGGSALVAACDGLSSDHLERLTEEDIQKFAGRRTVAGLLPLAYYFLRDTVVPPVELLRKHGVPMAVASDFNPGTSPFASLRLALNAACTLFGLTPAEALAGATRHAAQALNREKTHGQLKTGFTANFAVWEVERPVEIFYELGYNPLVRRVINGASGPEGAN